MLYNRIKPSLTDGAQLQRGSEKMRTRDPQFYGVPKLHDTVPNKLNHFKGL